MSHTVAQEFAISAALIAYANVNVAKGIAFQSFLHLL